MNSIEFIITKTNAELALTILAGISLDAVRGFASSISLSKYLLNAIAALRANIIHNTTNTNNCQLAGWLASFIAKKKPISAKGIAKTVWLNFIKDKKLEIDFVLLIISLQVKKDVFRCQR